jgi:hypothetical protein
MTIRSGIVVCWLSLAISMHFAAADNYPVTNTSDSGPGSLRQAITDANAHANIDVNTPDTISFAIPNSDPNRNVTTGVFTITPSFPGLPRITDPVVIDGYTQTGSSANTLAVGDNAVLLIELNGASAGGGFGGVSGLEVDGGGGGSTFRGLIINRFTNFGKGIVIFENNVKVLGNFIGTNSAGTAALGNDGGVATSGGFGGVGGGNQIGSSAPADRNLISGNGNGIVLQNATTVANTVQGNYIGVDVTGNGNLGNSSVGIQIQASQNQGPAQGPAVIGGATSSPGTGAGNVISGNVTDGIVFGVSSGGVLGAVTIQGNIIGLGVDGTTAVGNGVGIEDQSFGTGFDALLIGGTSATMRNIISANGDGILYASINTTVQGNFIGTDITGTLARGNTFYGIEMVGDHRDPSNPAATTITIGGTAIGAGNLISGNDQGGISTRFADAVIQGNHIGTQADGTSALGNGGDGITVLNFSAPVQVMVGGTAAGAGNVIANNAARGVSIGVSTVTVLGNSIFNNGPTTAGNMSGLGIDLGGIVPNDPGDADTGPNGLQNFPLLTSISSTGGNVSIMGTLNSVANQTYRIEFFANDALDPSGYGEGQTFVGFTNVTTDANGNASFNFSVPQIAGLGRVTSTATDPNGNTSEFSPSIGQLLNISTRLRVLTGDNALIGGFILTGSDDKKVIVRGIGPSLTSQNVPDALQDPTLELHDGTGATIASNDNWKDTQQAEIQATGIPPSNDLESAIVATLPANNSGYTAILRGKNDTTGVGLVEVYDLDQAANSKLANISTRGFVDTGDNAMIGGFIAGNGVAKVIVRAIGPSLTGQGVANALQDPTLELHDGSGATIASNDNWKDTQQGEIEATTIPPTDDRESAIVATLFPGNYTAIVRGKNDTTGVGLVEVYNIQ